MTDLTYTHTPEMGEISGFGGEYEHACQLMLNAGVHWLKAHPDADIKMGGYAGVVGLVVFQNPDAKELEKALLAPMHNLDSPTGAMVEAVAKRLFFIHHNGWESYCDQLTQAMENEDPTTGHVEVEIDREPSDPQNPPEDLNLVDTLQAVFGTQNVFIINAADDLELIESLLDFSKGKDKLN